MDLGSMQFFVKAAFEGAAESYGRALELADEIGDEVARGDCLTRIGEVRLAEGRADEAEAKLRKAADGWRTFADEMSNHLVQRRKVYKVVMCDDIDRVQFFDDHADTYMLLVRALLASSDADKASMGALLAAEEGRAATMRELLAMGPTDLVATADEAVAAEQAPATLRTAAVALEAAEASSLAGRVFADGKGAIVYFMLLDEPTVGLPADGPAPPPKRVCVAWVLTADGKTHTVKTSLAAQDGRSVDELVRDLHIKMAIASHGQPMRGDPRPDEAIEQYREHLETSGAPVAEGGEVEVDTELKALSAMLLHPLADYLPPGAPLCIVAHAELHLVPFCALPMPGGEPLGISHALSYAPSLTVLQLLLEREAAAAKKRSSASALVLGDPDASLKRELKLPPIPHSASEAEQVASSVGAQPEDLLVGKQAQLATVLDKVTAPHRLIHLSGHSCAKWVALAAEPSPLVLEGADGADGADGAEPEPKEDAMLLNDQLHLLWLEAHPTVVLSGSRCAYGEVSDDWVLGLPRTFLISGARSVVSSLWDAHDEATCALMTAFYAALRDTPELPQAEALRVAMQRVRDEEGGRWRHPLFWAGFTLTGVAKGI